MSLERVIDALSSTPSLELAREQLQQKQNIGLSVSTAGMPYAIASLARLDQQLLIVTASDRNVDEIAESLKDFINPESIVTFPAWETLPFERLSPSSETVGQRIAVLHRLQNPEQYPPVKALVMSARSLIQPISQGLGDINPITVQKGDELSRDAFILSLIHI